MIYNKYLSWLGIFFFLAPLGATAANLGSDTTDVRARDLTVSGTLDAAEGVRLTTSRTRPECNETTQGLLWLEPNAEPETAPLEPDRLWLCRDGRARINGEEITTGPGWERLSRGGEIGRGDSTKRPACTDANVGQLWLFWRDEAVNNREVLQICATTTSAVDLDWQNVGDSSGLFVQRAGDTMTGALDLNLTPTPAAVDANVTAYWNLDEATAASNAADLSGNERTLTVSATKPVVVPGITGNARDFSGGSNSWFARTGDATLNALFDAGNFTVELWAKQLDASSDRWIVGTGDSATSNLNGGQTFGIVTAGGGKIFTRWNAQTGFVDCGKSGWAAGGGKLLDGRLHHLAVTVEAEDDGQRTVKIYEDGALQVTCTNLDASIVSSNIFRLATHPANAWTSYYFRGVIDDVRISDKVRSAEEIAASYAAPAAASGVDALKVSLAGSPVIRGNTDGSLTATGKAAFGGDITNNGVHRTTDASASHTFYNSGGSVLSRWFNDGTLRLGSTNTDASERLYVDGAAFVGGFLTVNGYVGANGFGPMSTADNNNRLTISTGGGVGYWMGGGDLVLMLDSNNDSNNASFQLRKDDTASNGGTLLMHLKESGNLHIGYANASVDNGYKLDVNGSARSSALTVDNPEIVEAAHIADGSTALLYRLDGNGNSAVGDYPLSGDTPSTNTQCASNQCLAPAKSMWRADSPLVTRFRDEQWTIELWTYRTAAGANVYVSNNWFGFAGEQYNTVMWVGTDTVGHLVAGWQAGAAGRFEYCQSPDPVPLTKLAHVAARKTAEAGSTYQIDLFIDGSKVAACTGLPAATGGTTANRLQIGTGVFADGSTNLPAGWSAGTNGNPKSYIDDVRISFTSRPDANIAAAAVSSPVNAPEAAINVQFNANEVFRVTKAGKIKTQYGRMQGLRLPVSAAAPAPDAAFTEEGDIVWDSTGDKLYVYDGAAFKEIGSGGSGAATNHTFTVVSVATGAHTISASDNTHVVFCDANANGDTVITLPAASAVPGREIRMVKTDTSAKYCSLETVGENVWEPGDAAGANTQVRTNLARAGSCTVVSDGQDWWVVAGAACEGAPK